MAEKTLIAWTDHTANFWLGCTKVSPGCRDCYAETMAAHRMGIDVWGPSKPRKPVSGIFAKLRKWNKLSDPGNPSKVFVGSMMDWAEDRSDLDRLRATMWDAIRGADRLIFQMLTKRPERIELYLPRFWDEIRSRVWMGTSIENNDYVWRAERLCQQAYDAEVRFISYEPALGPLDRLDLRGIDWVIYGGLSGERWESSHEDKQWARDMKARCEAAGVAFFHKQSSAYHTERGIELDGQIVRQYPRTSLPVLF